MANVGKGGEAVNRPADTDDRSAVVSHLSLCVRRLLTEREMLAQRFALANGLSSTDFRALIHIAESELNRQPLAAGGLRDRMNMSAGAATYVVDRLVSTGHVRREADPGDRRKVVLRQTSVGGRRSSSRPSSGATVGRSTMCR